MLIGILPVIGLYMFERGASPSDPPLTASYLVIGALSLWGYSYAAAQDGFSFRSVFYFFCFAFFFVVPYFSLEFDLWKYGRRPDEALRANLMIIAWIICFQAAYMLQTRRSRAGSGPMTGSPLVRFRVKTLPCVCLLAILVFLALTIAVLAGPEALLLRGSRGDVSAEGTKAPMLLFQYIFKPASLFLFFLWLYRWRSSLTHSRTDALMLWALGTFAIAMNLPTASARFYVFIMYMAMICWWRPPRAGNGVFYTVVLYGGIYASSIIDVFRQAFVLSNLRVEFSWKYLFVGHFDAYEIFVNGIAYMEKVGITWGYQLLGVLFFWVPRGLWPDKPVNTGRMIAEGYLGQVAGLENFNKGAPLIAEAFVNYHVGGVVIGAWLLGHLAGFLDESWRKAWRDIRSVPRQSRAATIGSIRPDIFIAYPILVAMFLFWQRGSMQSAFAYTTGMAVTYLAIRLFVVRRTWPLLQPRLNESANN